jgi:hypothetical protein
MVVAPAVDEDGAELLRAAIGTPQFHDLAQELMPVPMAPGVEGGNDEPADG